MKKLIFATCIVAIMTGCQKVGGGSYYENLLYHIEITVNDANGNNLLDPAFEGNILKNNITATFHGHIYECEDRNHYDASQKTRAVDIPLGLNAWAGKLGFGLLPAYATKRYIKEKLVIDWGDGTTDTLWFTCNVEGEYRDVPNPVVTLSLWLKTAAAPDGELVDDDGLTVTIIKN